MSCRFAAAVLGLAAVSCSQRGSPAVPQRIAILRFENLSAQPSLDWMGRAFAEIVSRELAFAPGLYAIPPSRLHSLDAAFGKDPAGVPGISSERALAVAANANRLGYGEYWLAGGQIEARLTIEELAGGKIEMISASGADVLGTADALARQISSRTAAYGTRKSSAVEAYVLGLDAAAPSAAAGYFEQAIAADPDFAAPYIPLAQWKFRQGDRAGAAALLDQAAHRGRVPELERAQLGFEAATVRRDRAWRRRSLAEWARVAPNDPIVWRSSGEMEMNSHDYGEAVASYQRALAVEPDDPALLNQLGYAMAYAGNLAGAVRSLERYASLRPADANPLDSLGDVNLLFGRLREAEDYYLKAARKDPAFLGGGDFQKAAIARLMTGDVGGANSLERQYVERRVEAHDPLVDYYRAEWSWVSGSRKEAYQQLTDFARGAESGPLKEAAARAYAELAVWSVALGDRSAAAQMADKAGRLGGGSSAPIVAVARFLVQAPASAAEWTARAARAFPEESARPDRDRALVYALLADRQFSAALPIVQTAYENGELGAEGESALLLAWCDLETGHPKEAAGLLRFNPLPPRSSVQPFRIFYFPRLFYLRGRVALLAGQPEAARAQFRVFLQLSGGAPLAWGEEARAR